MTEESKYYTPEISEFHVGFEYEVQDLHDNLAEYTWRKQVFEGEETRTWFSEELAAGEIRVKYLGKDDIESLGWVKRGLPDDTNPIMSFRKDIWHIHVVPMSEGCPYKIYTIDDKGSPEFFFKGTIKNKSELSRLMKQLGIL